MPYNVLIREENIVGGFVLRFVSPFLCFSVLVTTVLQTCSAVIRDRFCVDFFVLSLWNLGSDQSVEQRDQEVAGRAPFLLNTPLHTLCASIFHVLHLLATEKAFVSCSAAFTAHPPPHGSWLCPSPCSQGGRDLLGLKRKLREPVAHAGHQIFPWGGAEHDNPALEGDVKAAGLREAVAHQETLCTPQEQSLCSLLYLDYISPDIEFKISLL